MALFGREKDEDEDYEDSDELDLEEDRQERKLTRKFKDLKRENRKKRKEPPKPWGKKERTTVFIILLLTILISAILAVAARGVNFLGLSEPGLLKINFDSLNIFKEETIIIEKLQ